MITPEELRELAAAPSKSTAESERERLIRRMKGAAKAGRYRLAVSDMLTDLRKELEDAGFRISESSTQQEYYTISWETKT
jgi:hypothetical protein